MDHINEKQQSSTIIEWCEDADDWGEEPTLEENGNVANNSQAIEICASASAELENSDADDNVVAEPIELPDIDVLQLLDSRKDIPSVSFLFFLITCRNGLALDKTRVKLDYF